MKKSRNVKKHETVYKSSSDPKMVSLNKALNVVQLFRQIKRNSPKTLQKHFDSLTDILQSYPSNAIKPSFSLSLSLSLSISLANRRISEKLEQFARVASGAEPAAEPAAATESNSIQDELFAENQGEKSLRGGEGKENQTIIGFCACACERSDAERRNGTPFPSHPYLEKDVGGIEKRLLSLSRSLAISLALFLSPSDCVYI